MNNTGIEWTQKTWNPIFGCWGPGGTAKSPKRCWYCYAEDVATNPFFMKCPRCLAFAPHIHPERIYEPLQRKKPTTIFVGSMSDMWGAWVPAEWIESVLQVIRACPQHTFLTLTKNWRRYLEYDYNELPYNLWLGVTITGALDKFEMKYSKPDYPGQKLGRRYFISYEPLLENVVAPPMDTILKCVDAAIIGPLNKRGHDPVTKREWVERIIEIADAAKVPVFLKNALYEKGIMPEAVVNQRQVTPWRM